MTYWTYNTTNIEIYGENQHVTSRSMNISSMPKVGIHLTEKNGWMSVATTIRYTWYVTKVESDYRKIVILIMWEIERSGRREILKYLLQIPRKTSISKIETLNSTPSNWAVWIGAYFCINVTVSKAYLSHNDYNWCVKRNLHIVC